MAEHPAVLTVRELRREIDRLVDSPAKSISNLAKPTVALIDSLVRHGDFDHVRTTTRKSAMLLTISDEVGFEYDTSDWRSPRSLTKNELIEIHEWVVVSRP